MDLWSLELQNDHGGIFGLLYGVFRNGLRTTASKQIMILMEEENCVVVGTVPTTTKLNEKI